MARLGWYLASVKYFDDEEITLHEKFSKIYLIVQFKYIVINCTHLKNDHIFFNCSSNK